MSSTNRGGQREVSDYYRTPVAPIVSFLRWFTERENFDLQNKLILDPCAGGDRDNEMAYPLALSMCGADLSNIYTVDIRPDSRAMAAGFDYLGWHRNRAYDLIISNPPFVLAQQFIEKALTELAPGGFLSMLLRLNYFGTQKRVEFWRKQMPKYAYVHSKRMRFSESFKSGDSVEYMHCVWQQGYKPAHVELYIGGV